MRVTIGRTTVDVADDATVLDAVRASGTGATHDRGVDHSHRSRNV
ncbi:hypothetical protein [Saccharopolyspora pogona]|nr:hypothetical protein [Saccharopolyspora pogona]